MAAVATPTYPDAVGNRFMVLEEYQEAVVAYTAALEASGLSAADRARLLMSRSAAHLELHAPAAAMADGHAAAALDPGSFLAPFREGKAAWLREDFAAAVAALQQALGNAGDPRSPQHDECAQLLSKSQAKLSLRDLQRAEAARAKGQREQAQIAAMSRAAGGAAAVPPRKKGQAGSGNPAAAAVAVGEKHEKKKKLVHYSHSHYQTDKVLYIEVQTGPVAAADVQHRFAAAEVWLRVDGPDATYTLALRPFAPIRAARAKCTVKADRVVLKIPKETPAHWDQIYGAATATGTGARAGGGGDGSGGGSAAGATLPSAYSSSKDWAAINRSLKDGVGDAE